MQPHHPLRMVWDADRRQSLTLVAAAHRHGGSAHVGSVIGIQALVGVVTRDVAPEQPIILVATTLLIAQLLRPLRRWLQAAVDRSFYRRTYDATRTLAAFSETLRHETNVEALRERLLAIVGETMQPEYASLWLLPVHGASPARNTGAQGVTKS